jgi:glycosyltransferase involved in cell wall biosynthesis
MARICQLAHVELTYNFLAPLIESLRAEGHEVVATCNMDAGGAYVRHYLGDDVPMHRINGGRQITWRAMTTEIVSLARYLRRERYDVVHVHGPLLAIQARIAARLAGVPIVIYHAHGFPFHDVMSPMAYRVTYAVERFFARHATNAIITVNAEDAQLAEGGAFRPRTDEIVYAPGVGIDVGRFRPAGEQDDVDRKACRNDLGVPSDAPVLAFVGRLVGYKGVRELVTAFGDLAATHPDLRLVLVGDTHESERDQSIKAFLEQMRDTPAGQRLILAGRRDDVPRILRSVDALVLPSYREGMPVSLLEAMASGLPCIASDIRGTREAIDDGVTGLLVPPRDPAALAQAINKVMTDAELRHRIGTAARARVVNRYTVGASREPQLALYRRLLSGLENRKINPGES